MRMNIRAEKRHVMNKCTTWLDELDCVRRVALRVFEVPLLSTALEALGKGHEERSIARAESNPKVVVLLTGQPIFFTWTPDGTVIIAVSASTMKLVANRKPACAI